MCGVADDVVGVCGFSVESCPVQTVAEFCTANPNATMYMGGLSGARAGFYGYAVLALCVPIMKFCIRWLQATLWCITPHHFGNRQLQRITKHIWIECLNALQACIQDSLP